MQKVEEIPISNELHEAIIEHTNFPLPGEYIETLNQRKSKIVVNNRLNIGGIETEIQSKTHSFTQSVD